MKIRLFLCAFLLVCSVNVFSQLEYYQMYFPCDGAKYTVIPKTIKPKLNSKTTLNFSIVKVNQSKQIDDLLLYNQKCFRPVKLEFWPSLADNVTLAINKNIKFPTTGIKLEMFINDFRLSKLKHLTAQPNYIELAIDYFMSIEGVRTKIYSTYHKSSLNSATRIGKLIGRFVSESLISLAEEEPYRFDIDSFNILNVNSASNSSNGVFNSFNELRSGIPSAVLNDSMLMDGSDESPRFHLISYNEKLAKSRDKDGVVDDQSVLPYIYAFRRNNKLYINMEMFFLLNYFKRFVVIENTFLLAEGYFPFSESNFSSTYSSSRKFGGQLAFETAGANPYTLRLASSDIPFIINLKTSSVTVLNRRNMCDLLKNNTELLKEYKKSKSKFELKTIESILRKLASSMIK